MKLTTSDISQLNSIINVCQLANIDVLLIDSSENGSKLSGINKDRTCVIITDQRVPQLEAGSKMALKDLKLLKQRLDLFKLDSQLSVDLKKKANGDVSDLAIKGTNASVAFRASPVNSVKCPTGIEDIPMKRIQLTREEVQLILNAEKAMGSKKITISVKKGNDVSVELSDSNNDLFTIKLTNAAEDIGEEEGPFVCFYFTDVFSSLVRAAAAESDPVAIDLFEASAKITVDGYSLTMIAPMDDQ